MALLGRIRGEAAASDREQERGNGGDKLQEVGEGAGTGGHMNLPGLDDRTVVTLPLPTCVRTVGG